MLDAFSTVVIQLAGIVAVAALAGGVLGWLLGSRRQRPESTKESSPALTLPEPALVEDSVTPFAEVSPSPDLNLPAAATPLSFPETAGDEMENESGEGHNENAVVVVPRQSLTEVDPQAAIRTVISPRQAPALTWSAEQQSELDEIEPEETAMGEAPAGHLGVWGDTQDVTESAEVFADNESAAAAERLEGLPLPGDIEFTESPNWDEAESGMSPALPGEPVNGEDDLSEAAESVTDEPEDRATAEETEGGDGQLTADQPDAHEDVTPSAGDVEAERLGDTMSEEPDLGYFRSRIVELEVLLARRERDLMRLETGATVAWDTTVPSLEREIEELRLENTELRDALNVARSQVESARLELELVQRAREGASRINDAR